MVKFSIVLWKTERHLRITKNNKHSAYHAVEVKQIGLKKKYKGKRKRFMSSTKTKCKKTLTRNKLFYGAQVSSYSMKHRYYLILHLVRLNHSKNQTVNTFF